MIDVGRHGRIRVLCVCFALLVSAIGMVAGQQVRCTCPSVRAEGRGQSDCTACEIGGRCTVDFNAFGPELETAALQRLQQAGVMVNTFKFVDGPAFTAFEMFGNDQKALADQVLVYLTVSAATRPDVNPNELKSLAGIVRTEAVQAAVMDTFGSAAVKSGRGRLSAARPLTPDGVLKRTRIKVVGDFVRVSPGCMEVQVSSKSWFMYKAIWAEAYNEERCGESQ